MKLNKLIFFIFFLNLNAEDFLTFLNRALAEAQRMNSELIAAKKQADVVLNTNGYIRIFQLPTINSKIGEIEQKIISQKNMPDNPFNDLYNMLETEMEQLRAGMNAINSEISQAVIETQNNSQKLNDILNKIKELSDKIDSLNKK